MGWGSQGGGTTQLLWREFGDYWDREDTRPIHLKEADALLNTLQAIRNEIRDARMDAWCDNTAVVECCRQMASNDPSLNKVMQELFQFTMVFDVLLIVQYIATKDIVLI